MICNFLMQQFRESMSAADYRRQAQRSPAEQAIDNAMQPRLTFVQREPLERVATMQFPIEPKPASILVSDQLSPSPINRTSSAVTHRLL